jgi:hypothetical protein
MAMTSHSSGPKPRDLLLATFGGKLWVKTPKGERGERPDWLNDPSHTAAEMAERPLTKAHPGKRGR